MYNAPVSEAEIVEIIKENWGKVPESAIWDMYEEGLNAEEIKYEIWKKDDRLELAY